MITGTMNNNKNASIEPAPGETLTSLIGRLEHIIVNHKRNAGILSADIENKLSGCYGDMNEEKIEPEPTMTRLPLTTRLENCCSELAAFNNNLASKLDSISLAIE